MTHWHAGFKRDIEALYARRSLTALGVGVQLDAQPPLLQVAGVRKRGGDVPVQVTDKWHLGSVGKSMTATMLGALCAEQVLGLDDQLGDLLADVAMHEQFKRCTLHQLLTHSAGVPANFSRGIMKQQPNSATELIDARRAHIGELLAHKPHSPPGQKFRYSNAGYTIAGHIAESRTGIEFSQLLQQRVFTPLQMQSAGFGAPLGSSSEPRSGAEELSEPVGHRVLFGWRRSVDPLHVAADNTPIIAPAGTVHMSLADLLTFGRAHLDGLLGNGDALGLGEHWQKLHSPVLADYACGWMVQTPHEQNYRLHWHNGSNTAWYTLLLLVPKHRAVLGFVTNDGAFIRAERWFLQQVRAWMAQLG